MDFTFLHTPSFSIRSASGNYFRPLVLREATPRGTDRGVCIQEHPACLDDSSCVQCWVPGTTRNGSRRKSSLDKRVLSMSATFWLCQNRTISVCICLRRRV